MPTTIVDVARVAGVSISTVSHVINGTRYVSDGTKQRVLAAIEATSYMPDALARSMRRDRSDTIGLIISDGSQSIFADMILGVEEEAREQKLVLMIANSRSSPDREMESVRVFREHRVQGLLVAEVAHRPNRIARYLKSNGIPLVLLDRTSETGHDQVGVETKQSMRDLVDYVLGLGHTDLLLVAGDTSIPTLRDRLSGFRSAVTDSHGIDVRVLDSLADAADAEAAMMQFWSQNSTRPTAIVSSSMNMTIGTLRAIRMLGVRIPEDVALVSFDQLPNDGLLAPTLTGLQQPAFEIGREATRLLVERIQDPGGPAKTIRLAPQFVLGDSSGGARHAV